MANKGDIYKVALPNGDEYNFKDKYVRENYRALNNNDFDTINVTELNSGNIINTGAARFLNTINGSISGNAATATKATGDESGNNIKASYASSFSISDHTITLKNKNGSSLSTVTVPDNNTTYTFAESTSNGYFTVTPSGGSAQSVKIHGLGTSAFKDAPTSGNASSTQVVMGNDTRLTDARPSSDVVQTYSASSEVPISGKGVAEALDTVAVSKTATGNPIELTDGADAPMVKCVTQITGSQDLHGYDKPWVGGAGKNIIPMTLSGIRARNVSGTWTDNVYVLNGITFTVLTDNAGNVTGIKANGTASNNTIISFPLFQMQNVLHYGTGGVDVINAYIYGGYNDGSWHPIPSIGNEQKSFTPEANKNYDVGIYIKSGYNAQNIVFYPMIRLSTESDPTFTPYSNICPITAYTEGEIEVRGKNLWNGEWEEGDIDATTGQDISGSGVWRTKGYISISPLTQYFVATDGVTGASIRPRFYDSNKNYIGTTTVLTGNAFNTPNNAMYLRFAPNASIVPNKTIGINYPSTYTTYEPYTSTTHTTTYPSAIYRGSEDVVNGEVTSEMPVIDLGDLTYTKVGLANGAIGYASSAISDIKPVSATNIKANLICSNYETKTGDQVYLSGSGVSAWSTQQRIVIADQNYADISEADFKSAMVGVQLAYELATPITSSVTPTNLPIKSLSGYNHIESSTGEMEIEYIVQREQPIVDLIGHSSGTVTSVAISNGGGLSVSGSPITSSGIITISHSDTSSQASISNSGRTYIQSVTLDTYGHVTKLTSATETVTDTKVTQTPTMTNNDYEILFSGTADNALRTEGVRKSSSFTYNPTMHSILVGSLKSNTTLGLHSSAFGYSNEASGTYSHAEGCQTTASGLYSHAEGEKTVASGDNAHAEGGTLTTASGAFSHAEGLGTTASGSDSHAEGGGTTASGQDSHAEGSETIASGTSSHAEGSCTTANHRSQHVFGEYNILDSSTGDSGTKGNYIEIVGNGTSSTRANARTLDWSGNEWLAGNLTLGGTASDITLNGTNNKWDGTNTSLKSALAGKLSTSTTYAGSSSVGGAATSADKLNTNAGQKGGNGIPDIPVYFSNGVPVANKIRIWTGSIAGNTDKVIDCAYGFVCVGRYYSGDRLWAGFVDQWGDGAMPIKATNTTSHCAVTVNTKGSKITISNKSSNYMSYFVIGSPTTES